MAGLKEKNRVGVGSRGLLTGTVAVLFHLPVLRWHPGRAARGGATAPLWTAQPAVGGLLEDRADETNPTSSAAVDLWETWASDATVRQEAGGISDVKVYVSIRRFSKHH